MFLLTVRVSIEEKLINDASHEHGSFMNMKLLAYDLKTILVLLKKEFP